MNGLHRRGFHNCAVGCVAGLCLIALAGCNTSGSNTSQGVRTTAETAPTDLQLLCASRTAEELQIENVLPVSSARSGEAAYLVTLTFEGGQATCIIDESGTVQNISQV